MRLITLALLIFAAPTFAQFTDNQARKLNCDDRNGGGGRNSVRHCEMREYTMPAGGRLNVDGGTNGGVAVLGWSRKDVLVRAQVQGYAPSENEARNIVSQINVAANAGTVRSTGPSTDRNHNWAVSYEVFVPWNSDLQLKTVNGGITINDVKGNLEFDAVNGGVHLKRLAGNVQGKTMNGGLHIELDGSRWDGTQLDARTTNGGVHMEIPSNYSARVETSTVNGGMHVDFPVTVQGEMKKQLNFTIGSGGPLIRVVTTNGGVHLNKRS